MTKCKKIVVITTGGTIAGEGNSQVDFSNYIAGQRDGHSLLKGLPIPEWMDIEVHSLCQIDSKDMTFTLLKKLAVEVDHHLKRAEVDGIVITHGTDTLEETGVFLHHTVSAFQKPVVLTAAMRPATAIGADGPLNLLEALYVAGVDAFGVLVVLDSKVYSGNEVVKISTMGTNAFSSGHLGVLANIESFYIKWLRACPLPQIICNPECLPDKEEDWPWIEIVYSGVGVTQKLLNVLMNQKIDGIVISGTGNGTIHESLLEGAEKCKRKGIPIIKSTRVPFGDILGESVLSTSLYSIPSKARIHLVLSILGKNKTIPEYKDC